MGVGVEWTGEVVTAKREVGEEGGDNGSYQQLAGDIGTCDDGRLLHRSAHHRIGC